MPPTSGPIFTVQTASLYASADASTFTGTGGPAAFSPFTGQFAGLVSSAGLAVEPFNDQLYDVDANDQVTFVIAVQNFGASPGYNLKLRDTLPVGFALGASDLTVVDGAGNLLGFSGNLFDAAGGMTITPPIAAFSNDAGTNVVLVTFTAYATNSILLPGATVSNTAQIISYAATSGGSNLLTKTTPSSTASTTVQTGAIGVVPIANQPAAILPSGQTASFNVVITLPEGTTSDFRIDEALPQIGSSWLQLVSTEIVSVGSHLTASKPVIVQPGGAIQLGTIVNVADNLVTAADQIVVRITVRGAGPSAGQGSINTIVSTADPNNSAARITQVVTNTVSLGPVNAQPIMAGLSTAQAATNSMFVLPFQTVSLSDPDVGQGQTLTIHLSNSALGTLSGPLGLVTNAAGDYVLTGTAAIVQAAARALLFTPSATGSGRETFSLTLDDGAGGVATGSAALTIEPAAHPPTYVPFPISAQTVLTSTATGSSTFSQVQTYAGAIGNVNTQFLYDGDTTLAIVAQQSGMLISSQAQATAVQLQGGVNVLDMQKGSSFVVSGTGTDTFLLHADQALATWNTISNFHSGDTAIVYGFNVATSARWWVPSAGAIGYTGATLRFDLDGNGSIDSSLTFAGKTQADVDSFQIRPGTVGGSGFLSISAV
ncbi:MAG: isopeptide-forming domain-containing fimbrial protein [Pseudomonadota bacterium]|nr:isopeptide-forming domain-containing fimbrial protein [Pseudomonadota bacterium]